MLGNIVFEDMSEILESLSIGILIVNDSGQISFANKKAFSLLSAQFEDVISVSLPDVLDYESLISAAEGVQNGIVDRVPVEFRLNDREIRATIYRISQEESTSQPILITLEDLSKFQELVDLKTEFISSLLHSLRTPMTTIKSGMSYLTTGDVKDTADSFFGEIVDMCSGEVNRLVEFLDDMRDLLLIEAGLAEHDLDEKYENVVTMVHDAITGLNNLKAEKHSDVKVENDEDTIMLNCDPRRFVLCMKKIIENALIFSPENATITVKISANSDRVNLDIIDEGIGIPASEIEYIFNKHFRGKNEVTQRVSGNGLGLYIARHFIELMNGSILVLSGKGRGTQIKVAFNRE
jgi:two-component system phosphate regulon sensor histidine kinase PhoR